MKDAIACASPFVPPEWVAAHGLAVERLVPPAADGNPAQGLCPFAAACAAWAAQPPPARAIVLATNCDQMRRTAERIARGASLPAFLLNVPATWQTPAARALYRAELERLGRLLVDLGGTAPTSEVLAETMRRFDARRRSLVLRRGRYTARQYADALVEIASDREPPAPDASRCVRGGARVALVGGPLRRDDLWIYDLLERLGTEVVLDATENAERSLPAPFDEIALQADPLAELVRAYFDTIPDAFRRPDTLLHAYLRRELRARAARGVILVRCAWCDQWHAQRNRLKESLASRADDSRCSACVSRSSPAETNRDSRAGLMAGVEDPLAFERAGLPLVEIDLGGRDDQLQRIRTRIETLVDIAR